MNYEEIGKRILEARTKLHISQEKASELCDISPSFYGNIERGEKILSVDTLSKISKALHVSADYLLFGDAKTTDDKARALIIEIVEKCNNFLYER